MSAMDDQIVDITRHEPFKMTISTDGVSLTVHTQGGFIEGHNFRGDVRMKRTQEDESPIIRDFRIFYQRMLKKYGQKSPYPFFTPNHMLPSCAKVKPQKSAKPKARAKAKKGGRG